MFCPIKFEQLSQVARTGWLYPFSWEEGNPPIWESKNIVFFDEPYCSAHAGNGIWIVVDRKNLLAWPGKWMLLNNNQQAVSFESGFPVIPGTLMISVENQVQHEKVVDTLLDDEVFCKWSIKSVKEMVSIEQAPISPWESNTIAKSMILNTDAWERKADRQRAIFLQDLLYQAEFFKLEERHWSKILEHLQILRDNKKLLENEDSIELRETKKILQKATGTKAESIHVQVINEEIANFKLNECEEGIHKFLVKILGIPAPSADLPDLIYHVLYKFLPEASKKKINANVRDWLAKHPEFGVWSLLAQMQKKPYDPVLHGDMRNMVREKAFEEKIPFIQESLLAHHQWNFDISTLASVILDILINDDTDTSGVDLLRKGLSSRHRSDIIDKIVNAAIENGVKRDIISELYEIQQANQTSFTRYTIQPPDYNVEVNSLLVFLMSTLDSKRIQEQCSVWKNTDLRLALMFHAALVGYEFLSGVPFQPFWDAIRSNSMLGEKMGAYLFELETAVTMNPIAIGGATGHQINKESKNISVPRGEEGKTILPTEKPLLEADADILGLIKRSNTGMTVNALAKRTSLPVEAIIEQLERLEINGLVARPAAKRTSWTYVK